MKNSKELNRSLYCTLVHLWIHNTSKYIINNTYYTSKHIMKLSSMNRDTAYKFASLAIWMYIVRAANEHIQPGQRQVIYGSIVYIITAQIAKFMGQTWGPPGSCRPQTGPMSAPWTLLSGPVADSMRHESSLLTISILQDWCTCSDLVCIQVQVLYFPK